MPTAAPRLVIIGGAEDRDGPCSILGEFVAMAGGPEARVVVIPAASGAPEAVGVEYAALFERLGARGVSVLSIGDRGDAQREDARHQIESATGVFFTGGDQLRIMNRLGGTGVDTVLHRRAAEGMVVGGTSAGAAVMSSTMIVEGETRSPRASAVRTGPGLEFLPGIIIDQHFAQRGRLGRLLAALAHNPRLLAIGVDEDTAAIVQGTRLEVMGSGAVTVVDGRDMHHSNLDDEDDENRLLSLFGLRLHLLCEGDSLDLSTGEPSRRDVRKTPDMAAASEPAAAPRS